MPETERHGGDHWMTTAEAVAYTGISVAHLLRLRRTGALPFGRVPGGRGDVRYLKSDLDAVMRSGAHTDVARGGSFPKRG